MHVSPKRLTRVLVLTGILAFAVGCTTTVKTISLSDKAQYFWLGSSASSPKSIYRTSDEKVVLRVVFRPNFIGSYRTFTVEWIQPDGLVYLSEPVSTKWGSNEILITALPIANNEPSRLPGKWKVRLLWKGQELVSRSFTIEDAPEQRP